MQEHMDILVVLAALGVALIVFFVIKLFSKKPESIVSDVRDPKEPEIGNVRNLYEDEEVYKVRKVTESSSSEPRKVSSASSLGESDQDAPRGVPSVYVLHVMANADQCFKGYELLQALLSQGLRFGEMDIFHRYQETNGKGPILFSLTSAVEPGTFDIHNMGNYSCPGLTLFLQSSGHTQVDSERFETMLKVAQNIARELDGTCLTSKRESLTEMAINQYRQRIYDSPVQEVEVANQ
jgi:cell division protein ZipA